MTKIHKTNIKIYKTMIQLSMIFSAIGFYYECCKSGRKERERGVGGNFKSGKIPSFPGTCHV